MKKVFIFTLVVVMLAISVTPALAANGTSHRFEHRSEMGNQQPYSLAGTIASLNPATYTVTVAVVCGNKLVKPFIGQNLVLKTTGETRFLLRNPDGTATPIAFEDLAVGQKLSSSGQLVDSVWTAKRITIGASLTCLP